MPWKKDRNSKNEKRRSSDTSPAIGRTGTELSGEVDDEMIEKVIREESKERIKDEKDHEEKTVETKARAEKRTLWQILFKREDKTFGDVFREKGSVDRPMLILILVLICFGSVMVFSASYAYALNKMGDSYYYIKRQLAFVALGLFIMFVVSRVDYTRFRQFAPVYYAVSFVLMGAVLLLGVAAGEAQRWIDLGPFTIQPSEIMKLGLVLILAWYYSVMGEKARNGGFWKTSALGTFLPMLIVGATAGMVALEKHLSGTIIMFLIGMIVIFTAGGKAFWFVLGIGGFSGIVWWIINNVDYVAKRWDIWRHPENYSVQSEVWQTLQGKYAIGSGGIFGVGLGNSRQKHLFVSQPQNDFIFSILCEELGLIGAFCVIALFVMFLIRGIIIAKRAPDVFAKLTVIGIVAKVTVQAFLNIAVVTDTIPNTGVSLPFFSYGGTALIILFAEMGVLLSISRYSYLQKQ